MVKNNINGSIINMNSIYGLLGQDLSVYEKTSIKENMSYSIIKGGLANLTRQMASYYGKFGIRINSICSGGVYSTRDQNFRKKRFIKNYKEKFSWKNFEERINEK